MPSRLCFNSGTQYGKEKKVELNAALGGSKERKTNQTFMCKLVYRFANIINKILTSRQFWALSTKQCKSKFIHCIHHES